MNNKFLPEDLREQIIEHLVGEMISNSFGDGLEKDYARDGFPKFRGYTNYTDEQLILELITGIGPDNSPTGT